MLQWDTGTEILTTQKWASDFSFERKLKMFWRMSKWLYCASIKYCEYIVEFFFKINEIQNSIPWLYQNWEYRRNTPLYQQYRFHQHHTPVVSKGNGTCHYLQKLLLLLNFSLKWRRTRGANNFYIQTPIPMCWRPSTIRQQFKIKFTTPRGKQIFFYRFFLLL